jgi:hypothetical protein
MPENVTELTYHQYKKEAFIYINNGTGIHEDGYVPQKRWYLNTSPYRVNIYLFPNACLA